jgi:glycosyltransferase involved in cell wall biosynthesis
VAAPRPRPRLLLVLPCAPDAPRGNATTAARLAEELGRRGWEVETTDADALAAAAAPEMIVVLHAVRAAPQAAAQARAWGVPYVVLFTGTDLNGKPTPEAVAAVEGAAAAVALGRGAARRARELFPGARDAVHTIAQGVGPMPFRPGPTPEALAALPTDAFLVLVPAGVRAVKDPLRAVDALDSLHAERPELRLIFLGPELETETGVALRAACAQRDWADWIDAVPRAELPPWLRRADLVLSTSRSEGGAPNSLLEAVLHGTPVLASSIPAHREFPGAAHCFRDDGELRKRLRATMDEPDPARMEVRKLQEIARQVHSPNAEALAWDRLLRPMLAPA